MPVGQGLAARPARQDVAVPHAGLTFTILRTLSLLPPSSASRVIGLRLIELRDRAAELPVTPVAGESAATWQQVIEALDAIGQRAVAAPAPAVVEQASGRDIQIRFDTARCIHARHCVLQAPSVFKANTPGEWIFPDTMPVNALVAVAEQCPSGAISYQRRDGGANEAAPPVNLLRVRESGPYAVHAPLVLNGRDDGFRATLCRCGQSRNKPYCDGSHSAAGFAASGEPSTQTSEALAVRGGVLHITPLRNGPLKVQGNLEITSGTGRTVCKLGAPNVGEARLCRCGQSQRKPFCDGSHAAAGFMADGAS
jgi:CDGSH-type Zn-finger protein/uncharacterized Fe-S cluster protein YjdI